MRMSSNEFVALGGGDAVCGVSFMVGKVCGARAIVR